MGGSRGWQGTDGEGESEDGKRWGLKDAEDSELEVVGMAGILLLLRFATGPCRFLRGNPSKEPSLDASDI